MSDATWIAFLLAAAIGAPARYIVDTAVRDRTRGAFPWGTLAVNVSGCFLLGLLTGVVLYHGVSPNVRTVAGTGGLGAYTTFSTFTLETVQLAEQGDIPSAARNTIANLVLGVAAAAVGLALTAAL